MTDSYLVPGSFGSDEFTEKKSRFISSVWRCETEGDALARLEEMNRLHAGAGHNVYAYIIRENNIIRYSDNGEPQGTAGIPVLDVFRRENVTNVCCVVTRYFGGILLGTGGLRRAYTHAAKIGLDAAGIEVMCLWSLMSIQAPYNLQERIKNKLDEAGAVIENIDYGAEVLFEIKLKSDARDDFESEIVDLTAGICRPLLKSEIFAPGKV